LSQKEHYLENYALKLCSLFICCIFALPIGIELELIRLYNICRDEQKNFSTVN